MKRTYTYCILFFFSFLSAASCQLETEKEYLIEDSILIETRDGAFISAIVVRDKRINSPQPIILQHTIYVRNRDINTLKHAVNKGYIGVMTYSRGKKNSPDTITPYENEVNDTYDVIDWISKQSWSNGKIGMHGGSYNGFTQWAATKNIHPALKTIVPTAANRPGNGLPMENNIFINPNYEWAFYVGNNKTLDTIAGFDRQRFRRMQNRWWASGTAYRKIDSIDGTPNKYLQKWLLHPSYDSYWQSMVPFREDFSKINIPILTFDGYYNDSQNSNLFFYREHYKYNNNAENYLVIGAYDHIGSQKGGEEVLRGYALDKVGIIDPLQITYQWFDYILKDGEKPKIIKDKVNYQVMGDNTWQSASSIETMSNKTLKFYLSNSIIDENYQLSFRKPKEKQYLSQTISFADRAIHHNTNSYPDPILTEELNLTNCLSFLTTPFDESFLINGSFSGNLKVSINKKDMDVGILLFEVLPNGKYNHLSAYIGRASYAKDETTRQLLKPNMIETIPFSNTRLISKRITKGSRLLVLLDVNKNSFSQLNYGTGKDVSFETIKDAKEPLEVKWYMDSYIHIPIWQE